MDPRSPVPKRGFSLPPGRQITIETFVHGSSASAARGVRPRRSGVCLFREGVRLFVSRDSHVTGTPADPKVIDEKSERQRSETVDCFPVFCQLSEGQCIVVGLMYIDLVFYLCIVLLARDKHVSGGHAHLN